MSHIFLAGADSLEASVALVRTHEDSQPVSLENRLLEGIAQASRDTHLAQASIQDTIASGDVSNPEVLARVQAEMAQYNVDVTLINALVRKAVSTVETLLRAS